MLGTHGSPNVLVLVTRHICSTGVAESKEGRDVAMAGFTAEIGPHEAPNILGE